MRDEIVEVLSEVPDGIVVDATLGGAGHAAALLAANDGISILGLDRDEMALAAAGARLAAHGDRSRSATLASTVSLRRCSRSAPNGCRAHCSTSA